MLGLWVPAARGSAAAAAVGASFFVGPLLRLGVGALVAAHMVAQKWLLLGRLVPHGDEGATLWDARSLGAACWLAQFRVNLNVDAWLQPLAYTEVYAMLWRRLGATVGVASRIGRVGPPDHDVIATGDRQGSKRVIQRRFNVSVPRARVSKTASTRRERSEG